MLAHAMQLPGWWCENTQRQQADTVAVLHHRYVDVRAIGIVAIAAKNIGDFCSPSGVEQAKQENTQRAKCCARRTKPGRRWLIASGQYQRRS